MTETKQVDELRTECWNEALKAYGTAYIFQRRMTRLKAHIQSLNYFGLVVPLVIGGIALAFGLGFQYFNIVLWVGGALGIVQLALFAWAIVHKWNDNLVYSLEAMTDNFRQSDDYQELAKDPPKDLKQAIDLHKAKYQHRNDLDERQGLTQRERRLGMRAGLWRFERPCYKCGKIPETMEPSDCNVCGNFFWRNYE